MNNLKRFLPFLILFALSAVLFSACVKENNPKVDSNALKTTESQKYSDSSAESEQMSAEISEKSDETKKDVGLLKKIQGYADETGIYAFLVTLGDTAADKGEIEFVYHGPKSTGEENVIVCTFHADYEKNASETFDYSTYFNGKIDLIQKNKAEVKISCTFGAVIRGGDVTVYYAPDGQERQEVYHAVADDFR